MTLRLCAAVDKPAGVRAELLHVRLWLFWLAPLIGGAVAGLAYRWLASED
jgi:glycerol uptake facilitator-like aquaporin